MTTTNQNQTGPQQNPNGDLPEGYLTKEELATRLKKTERTIENWQRKGILPFVKLGHSVLFIWTDVDAHLKANFRVVRRRRRKAR